VPRKTLAWFQITQARTLEQYLIHGWRPPDTMVLSWKKRVNPTLKEKFTNLSNVSRKGETLCHTGATTG
tara:strand:- start:60 stop:266 length:207 start_codon:yes stop_codon:yes gene_type:complete